MLEFFNKEIKPHYDSLVAHMAQYDDSIPNHTLYTCIECGIPSIYRRALCPECLQKAKDVIEQFAPERRQK